MGGHVCVKPIRVSILPVSEMLLLDCGNVTVICNGLMSLSFDKPVWPPLYCLLIDAFS